MMRKLIKKELINEEQVASLDPADEPPKKVSVIDHALNILSPKSANQKSGNMVNSIIESIKVLSPKINHDQPEMDFNQLHDQ